MSEEVKSKREISVTIHVESESATRMKLKAGKFEMVITPPTFQFDPFFDYYSGQIENKKPTIT